MDRRRLLLGTASLAALRSNPALADEYFGKFSGEPPGILRNTDPPLFELTAPFWFDDPNGLRWEVPAGEKSDGASIPRLFWAFAAPFSGPYLYAALIHDYFCRQQTRTAHDTHRDFYYGMMANRVAGWQASFMYWAVATFGPQWQLQGQALLPLLDGFRVLPAADGDAPGLSLDDPVLRAAVKAKAAAVARTLKSSDGALLDPSVGGTIPATLDAIDESAAYYRRLLSTGTYLDDPKLLGVLGVWSTELSAASWGETVPDSKAVPDIRVLFASGNIDEQQPFVISGTEGRAATAALLLEIDKLAG